MAKAKRAADSAAAAAVCPLEKAELYLALPTPDERGALRVLEKASAENPRNMKYLLSLVDLLTSAEDTSVRDESRAYELLRQSFEVDASSEPERYFYWAQLLSTNRGDVKQCLSAYEKGIEILKTQLEVRLKLM